jgi:CheY-like chemotaxis protein
MGFAICSQLVWSMGGQIDPISGLGQGNSFSVVLPWTPQGCKGKDTASGKPEAVFRKDQLTTWRFMGVRVLVVDDHPVNVMLLEELLSRLGCVLKVARDGLEAVSVWKQGGLDLVLMDVQMPGISGLEATRQIREHEAQHGLPRTPIVAVTANAAKGDREICMAAGMDSYLCKPINCAALVDALGAAREDQMPVDTPAPLAATTTKPPAESAAGPIAVLPSFLSPAREDLEVDADTLRKMAALLKKDMPHRKALLMQALEAQNAILMLEQTHLLRGVLGLVSAERAERLIKDLEMAARSSDWNLFVQTLPLLEAAVDQLGF